MNPMRRFRVPVPLIGALVALLVFSATAAAETRTGESASPIGVGSLAPELTLVKASASYETTGGSVRFDITTAAAPQTESQGEMAAELLSISGECSFIGLFNLHLQDELPMIKIFNKYNEPTIATALVIPSLTEIGPPLPATKTPSGTMTTLSFTSSAIADKSYNCAVVAAADPSAEELASNMLILPISAPPPPTPTPSPSTAPTTVPAQPTPPAPTPAALSIGKLKPLKLKAEKWKTVRVKVTNTGGTATAPGSLRVRAPAKVLVKPEKQKLPALAPGASWTVAVRVRLPAKPAKKTTLRLVGAAPGVSATLPLVIRVKR